MKNSLQIALTRPVGQNMETEAYARELGFNPSIYPLVRLEPASGLVYDKISLALKNHFRSVVFTSKRGIEFLEQYLETQNKPLIDLIGSRICFAMGPITAQPLKRLGITPYIPKVPTSKHLADLIINHNGKESCSPAAVLRTSIALGRPPTPELREANIEVQEFVVYETLPNSPDVIDSLIKNLLSKKISTVIFTSSYAVDVLFTKSTFNENEVKTILKRAFICSIGPTTTKTLNKYDISVDFQPRRISVNHLLEELRDTIVE